MSIQDLIKRGSVRVLKRCSIKRLALDGTYETDWVDISSYVVAYNEISWGYADEAVYGETQIAGTTLVLNNAERRFNSEADYASFFRGYLTRYRCKFKVEYGFFDDDGAEVEGLVWYGVLYSDPVNHGDGTIEFSIASTLKAFENYTASDIPTTAGTTAQLVGRLCTKEVNGARVFDQFFEGATDADKYKINVSADAVTSISAPSFRDDETCWKKITDYSTYDSFVPYVDNSGAFVWEKRAESASLAWVFNGPGSFNNDYGVNIISIDSEVDGNDSVFTRVAIEYQDNTFVTDYVAWTPGDGSFPDIYGERTYSKQFYDLNLSNAGTVATNILTVTKQPNRRWVISTPMIPHLQINDLVEINYSGQILPSTGVFVLGVSSLSGSDVLGRSLGSINLIGVSAKITNITLSLDNNLSTFTLQEV